MDILDANTIVVYSTADLAFALGNNSYNYIYLGADIIMTSGITIDSSKTSLIIDGVYTDISTDARILTDQGVDTGMIMISSPINITFKNLIIAGRNYYGMPRVADGAAGAGTTVTYQSVTYIGPQTIYHRNGLTRYIDCNIKIQSTPGYSSAEEVGQVRWVEIGGKTTIDHGSTSTATFWFYNASSSLTILQDANVQISTVHDFLYRSNDYPQFIIQQNASLTLTTQYGIPRDTGHYISSFLVDKNATFRYIRTSTDGTPSALYINGLFTVNEGANVYMEADFQNNGKLIQFVSSAVTNGLYLNKPRSFVLYNSGTQSSAGVLGFDGTTPYSFTAGQINIWTVATPKSSNAGDFFDVAPGRWHKSDWSTFLIKGSASSSVTTIEERTINDSDIDPKSPLSMFNLATAEVLSVGILPLKVDKVICQYKRVSGNTDPEGRVMIEYEVTPYGHSIISDVDEDGNFSVPTENQEQLPAGTSVTVSSNIPFLITTISSLAQDEGVLEIIKSPDLIKLIIKPIPNTPDLLPRETPDDPVVISDTRAIVTPWQLFAKITGDLETTSGDILNDGVVFSHEDDVLGNFIVLEEEFKLVHEGTSSEVLNPDYPDLIGKIIVWASDRGVLGRINNPVRLHKEYTTQLIWEVRPLPTPDEENG